MKFDSIWSSIQPLIRLLLVSAVLNLTASCSPAGADPELPTPTMASGTSIKFVDMPLDASNDLTSEPTGISTPKVPSAVVTSAESAKTAQLEPSQLQSSSTLQPELSPKIPCAEDLCVYSAVLYLQRPIDPAENDAVDATYRFGSTQSGRRDPHHGVEFLNGFGTPVLAAADGRVVVAGGDLDPISPHGDWPILFYGPYSNFYGSLVVIEHILPEAVETAFPDLESPLYTLYGHLSEISVEVGQQVSAGEQIGRVGMAGIATGSHLHFEVRLGENSYTASRNPELWLQPHSSETGKPNGALAGRFLDGFGNSIAMESIVLQRLPNGPEGESDFEIGALTYEEKGLLSQPPFGESFGLGDLPPGLYRVSFPMNGFRNELVQIYPGQLTVITVKTQ